MPDGSERERLIQFMTEHELSYKDLAHRMKWSPTFIFGALGGAWPLTNSFRQAFAETFGADEAAQVFYSSPVESEVSS
jgi:hypothetical protein